MPAPDGPQWHHTNNQLFMLANTLRKLPVHPGELTTEDENSTRQVVDRSGGQRFMRPQTPDEALWERKEKEAVDSGVYSSVMRQGIVNPVVLDTEHGRINIANGFHRVASVDPLSFVPIRYVGNKEREDVSGLPEHGQRWGEIPAHPVVIEEEPPSRDFDDRGKR